MKRIKAERNNLGQGMVEFAIVFPLLLLLLFGIFEFGRVMFAYSAAVSSSREAARYGAAILDTGGGIPQYEDCNGIREAAKKIGQYAGITDADITIQYSNESGIYSSVCPPTQEVSAADVISVSISTSITPTTPIGNFSAIPIYSSSSRTILKNVKLGVSGTGAGSVSGSLSDINFKTTSQTVEESMGTISVVLELNATATDVVTVPFSITGTALEGAGEDYLITSSPVTINPGGKTAVIYITLKSDGIAEGDESLVLGIDDPINATKGPQNIHIITIVDPPDISFSTASSVHAENSPVTALMVELSKGSSQDVSVSFNWGGTAVWGAGADYLTTPSTVTIPSGSLSAMVMLNIIDDTKDEEDEIAVITLDSPVNGQIGAVPAHSATIVDNDNPPLISFYTANQIVSEEIGVFATSLILSEISGKDIFVPYSPSGTTIPADYVIHDPSPLFIPAGNASVDITMDILEGDGWEVDETLIITLGTPQNANLGSPAQQTIVITESLDEPSVSFVKNSQSLVEGDQILEVGVRLSNAWSYSVTVPFTVTGSAQGGSGGDFSISSSPLVIPVGWTQGSITVLLHDDLTDESIEDIWITMGEVEHASLGDVIAHQIQVVDNDSPPEVFFTTLNKTEEENTGTVSVTISLSVESVNDVSIPLNLSGTAGQGSDYSISTTNLVIPAGSQSGSFQITVVDDGQYEPNEKVIVDLGFPTNGVLGAPTSFALVIEDNELPPCDVGSHLLTVGVNSINLSMVNEGEDIILTGGTLNWTEALPNSPRLTSISFSGSVIYTGINKPPSMSYTAWESFTSLATESITFQFDGELGTGEHVLLSNFQNLASGTTCSLTETFSKH